MALPHVGIVGAAGETGSSITNALISSQDFRIVALTRPASLEKPAYKAYQKLGVTLRPFDIDGTHEDLVGTLSGIDILISCIAPLEQIKQISLATAAKAAGIKRFLPCAFRTILPPMGLHMLREVDEQIMNHIKLIKLPYTYVDVGAWYELSVPILPSGKTAYLATSMGNYIAGDGESPTAMTHLADIGRYVARVIVDDRTLNRYVFVYNELWTMNQIYAHFESISGEEIKDKIYQTEEQLRAQIAIVPADSQDMMVLAGKIVAQYGISWGIRGDNQPEYAKYLGYVTSKELYPDFDFTPFEHYAKLAVEGNAKPIYEEMKARMAALQKSG